MVVEPLRRELLRCRGQTQPHLLAQCHLPLLRREEHGGLGDRAHASAASRTPLKSCRRCGRSQFLNVTRATSGSVAHEPPRRTRCSSPKKTSEYSTYGNASKPG